MSIQRSPELYFSPNKSVKTTPKSHAPISSPAHSPYPYNRHAEICSVHCGSHLKNTASPVTQPRLAASWLADPGVSPQKLSLAASPAKQRPSPAKDVREVSRPPVVDRPSWPTETNEQTALTEFENFLQQNGQNSLNGSFAQFDSFSQKKPSPHDALEQALRESEQLSSYLEGTVRQPSRANRENIFKG